MTHLYKLYKALKSICPSSIKVGIYNCILATKNCFLYLKLLALYRKYSRYTMIPKHLFLENLNIIERFREIDGAVVECGVWRGGMIAAIAERLGGRRSYYLFDSFEGLPEVKEIDGDNAKVWQENKNSPFYFDNCKAEELYATKAMSMAGATDYQIIKGWFSETLPLFDKSVKIFILRLDGDWYESTIQCLEGLYAQVVPGGLIIIDDYLVWDGCSKAVHEFLSKNKSAEKIFTSKMGVCYIIKK